ncbi:phospholipase/carboxylesterase [Gregarina niphandrodes]|uniref:Phospholipase/carboxylesterase n=1 Tax=Gregarina niphandrodes TaxID=110365 RepID=A0A023BCF3_GRENI|nr:phospholipase/carboxylesterase [Gregarina niphandrodes]EZG83569.1 phospholipase/carboxylesterase [Gregarina niphandrodes]|eukprot:XP_011128930.1 phospholipase/carboxylesterase [Gregarina niphandrodes]
MVKKNLSKRALQIGPTLPGPALSRPPNSLVLQTGQFLQFDDAQLLVVVFLHGLGSDGNDMKQLLTTVLLKKPDLHDQTVVLCPNAGLRPISWVNGQAMTAWGDIFTLGPEGKDDWEGFEESRKMVEGLIDQTLKENPTISNIVIGGFSQGGALSYHIALQSTRKLAGLIVMSGWVPARMTPLGANVTDIARSTKILHCHGKTDFVVRWSPLNGQMLDQMGVKNYDIKLYENCAHEVCTEEIADIMQFLTANL